VAPGSDIFIHGGDRSRGCIALSDEGISEVYLLALWARESSRQPLPVHIFPCRMEEQPWGMLRDYAPETQAFWRMVQPCYEAFEATRRLPAIHVSGRAYCMS
jgi:murein L,D-transpeptidase YafK